MRLTLKLTLFLAIGACTADPAGIRKTFVYENFTGEGRPEYQIVSHQIELRDTPDSKAAITRTETVSKGQNLSFDAAVTRTLKTGQIEMLGEASIQFRDFGEIDTLQTDLYYDESITWSEKTITAEDKPTLLMWMAEGNCLIKIKQTVNESSECPTESGSRWKLTNQPVTESWIEVKMNDKKGWVKIDDQQIKEISRSF